jgi:peptidoglycan/LPS O-acetylase OafA/YrhL
MELRHHMGTAAAVRTTDIIEGSRPIPTFEGRSVPDGYLPEVDALRCFAMTSVIFFHCKLMPFGWMGVWLFFVVSGFAVTTSLFGGRPAQSKAGAIRSFYVRRALRIWPIYYLFIVLNVLVILALGKIETLEDLPSLLTFTFNMKMIFKHYTPYNTWGGFQHLWTLSVEQQFYLVFPLLLLLRGRTARGLALASVIVLAPLIRAMFGLSLADSGWDPLRTAFGVYAFAPAHFDAFALGALIALFRAEIEQNIWIFGCVTAFAATIVIVYGGFYSGIAIARSGHVSLETFRNIFSGIVYGDGREIFAYMVPTAIAAACIVAIISDRPLILRICRLPGLQFIGRISYGGYLFHLPVLMLLTGFIPIFAQAPDGSFRGVAWHIALFACAYPVTIAVAWLSFRVFEQPAVRLGRYYL